MRYAFTITDEMRRRPETIPNRQMLYAAIGRIQRYDVGKRVFVNDDGSCYQVEHDDQRQERLAKADISPEKSREILAKIEATRAKVREKLALLDELEAAITYRTMCDN